MSRGFGLQGADKAERLAHRSIYIPKHARLVPGPAGCAVYAYTPPNALASVSKFYAMGFRGTAGKPEWHHAFGTEAQRDAHITEFWSSVKRHQEYQTAKSAKKAAWENPLIVGALLVSSWGYDQTNVDYYVVTRVSGRRVWIRPIAQQGESTGWCQERVKPAQPIKPCGEETMHVAQPGGDNPNDVYIKVGHNYAHVTDGHTAHHSSSYA